MANEHILVVEDDVVFCKLLTKLLAKEDYQIQGAQDMLSAKELAENYTFDFVILDYRLPGTNGLKLAKWLIERQENVKVILMSRILDKTLMEEAQQLGVVGFMKKPLSPTKLLELIKQNSQVQNYV